MANYLVYLIVEEENDDDINYLRAFRRNLRDASNPFEIPESRFVELFRFPRYLMLELIEEMSPHMRSIRRHRVPKFLRILSAISFFASGSYQRVIGSDASVNLSQAEVSRSVSEICNIICRHFAPIWIRFPDIEDYVAVKERFMTQYNIPGVIGCVDGSHVAIVKPNANIQHAYYNRKGYHSKNVLIVSFIASFTELEYYIIHFLPILLRKNAKYEKLNIDLNAKICNLDYKILALSARHAGASHDSFIWQTSIIRQELERRYEEGNKTSWLLGDSGYPLEPFLMTPVRNAPEGSPASRYNLAHARARSCVERCIGVLKTRFRCLLKDRVLHYSPEKSGRIISTCVVLHNIMVEHRVQVENIIEPINCDDINNEAEILQDIAAAQEIRQNIINVHFN